MLRGLSVLTAFLLCSPGVQAQTPPAPAVYDKQTLETLPTIVSAAQRSAASYDMVAHLSDTIGPRISGSAQAAAAVAYVAQAMRDLGLRVRLEPVMVPHWVRGEEHAELVDWPQHPSSLTQRIVLTALGMSPATRASGVTLDVIVVHDFAQLHAQGANVRGKIVLFDEHFNTALADAGEGGAYGAAGPYRFLGPNEAAKLGAAAALVRSLGGAEFRLPHTGVTFFEKGVTPIPAAAVAAEDADMIDRLASRGAVRMHLTLTPKLLPDVESANVIGDLPGSEHPEQIVIVSGHLDSWDLGRGAIDDGAGFAQAFGTVSVLQALHIRPRRTIRCIAWMTEEINGAGSAAYARDEGAHAAQHVAALESDLGADHPLGIGTSLSVAGAPWLDPVAAALTEQGSPVTRYQDGSEADVERLARLGVPVFSVLQDSRHYFDYHHTSADTLDKIDPIQLAQNTAVMAALSYALADAKLPPPREPFNQ